MPINIIIKSTRVMFNPCMHLLLENYNYDRRLIFKKLLFFYRGLTIRERH
jgi:hypothetical protein